MSSIYPMTKTEILVAADSAWGEVQRGVIPSAVADLHASNMTSAGRC